MGRVSFVRFAGAVVLCYAMGSSAFSASIKYASNFQPGDFHPAAGELIVEESGWDDFRHFGLDKTSGVMMGEVLNIGKPRKGYPVRVFVGDKIFYNNPGKKIKTIDGVFDVIDVEDVWGRAKTGLKLETRS